VKPNQEKNKYTKLFIERNKGFIDKTEKLCEEAEQSREIKNRSIK